MPSLSKKPDCNNCDRKECNGAPSLEIMHKCKKHIKPKELYFRPEKLKGVNSYNV